MLDYNEEYFAALASCLSFHFCVNLFQDKTCSSLFALCSSLFALRSLLFALRSLLFALFSALCSLLFALCSSLFALCSSLFALCSSLFALCSRLCAKTGTADDESHFRSRLQLSATPALHRMPEHKLEFLQAQS